MRIKTRFRILLAVVLLLTMTGCNAWTGAEESTGNSKKTEGEKTIVTMMYPAKLDGFEKLVESTYEDIDLQVELTTTGCMNSDSERRLRKGHGTDIITTTLPTGVVKDYTMDLSTEEFMERYQSTVMKRTLIDGETHYIPLPGQYYGFVLNETLAKQLVEKLPENNQELLELMEEASEQQVGVYEDGTMFGMEKVDIGASGKFFMGLQIPDFLSQMDGIQWVADFEEGNATFAGAWDNCMDWMKQLEDKGYFNASAYQAFVTNAMPVLERMEEGTMLICYGDMRLMNRLNEYSDQYEYTMLPFMSDKGNPSWVTSSPDAYLAVNQQLEEEGNEEVLDACLRVLDLLSTQEGQNTWISDTAVTNTASSADSYLLEYENPEMDLPEALGNCISQGYVYNFQLSSDIVYCFGEAMVSTLGGEMEVTEALKKVDDYVANGSEEVEYDQSLVGSLEEDLLYENYNVRLEETAIGNLIADAVAEYTGCDMAVANGGAIRASLYAGDVYGSDLSTVCPYGNHIILIETTGKVIREMLENGISQTDREGAIPAGRFLQVSGLCYTYRPMTEDTEAELISVTLPDGTPLDDDQTYQIAVTDYMAGASGYKENNGDGYTMLNLYSDDVEKAQDVTLIKDTNGTYADAMKEYFQNHEDSAISSKCEGRITVTSEDTYGE